MPLPGTLAPSLKLQTLNSGAFSLADNAPANGTVLVFFRGKHCPICMRQLTDLEKHLTDFAALDIAVVAISGDDLARTGQSAEKAGLSDLTMAYELDLAAARNDWGLYISKGRPDTAEPDFFSEPGLFWVRGDNTVWFSSVQSMPFVRPSTADLLGGIGYILKNDYPLRGGYIGAAS